jgi:hypothetical protein
MQKKSTIGHITLTLPSNEDLHLTIENNKQYDLQN